jgi:predicted nucleotidyltransferase
MESSHFGRGRGDENVPTLGVMAVPWELSRERPDRRVRGDFDDQHKAALMEAARQATITAGFELRSAMRSTTKIDNLRRAAEYAMQAVLVSWGVPARKPQKLWTALEVLTPHLNPRTSHWIRLVRAGRPADLPYMTAWANQAIMTVAKRVGTGYPPTYWPPVEPRHSLGWEGLTNNDRAFLLTARYRLAWMPGASLWIFGSRSTGTRTPDSDCDVMLVYADGTPERSLGQAMGDLRSAADEFRINIDQSKVSATNFRLPSSRGVDRLLNFEVRAYGIEVPG